MLWGLGASLGFPVGMSAAADEPEHAPGPGQRGLHRSAYTAFLAGPPLLGFLGDQVGTLHALLAVAVLLIPSALLVPARPPSPALTKCVFVRRSVRNCASRCHFLR